MPGRAVTHCVRIEPSRGETSASPAAGGQFASPSCSTAWRRATSLASVVLAEREHAARESVRRPEVADTRSEEVLLPDPVFVAFADEPLGALGPEVVEPQLRATSIVPGLPHHARGARRGRSPRCARRARRGSRRTAPVVAGRDGYPPRRRRGSRVGLVREVRRLFERALEIREVVPAQLCEPALRKPTQCVDDPGAARVQRVRSACPTRRRTRPPSRP